MVTKQDKTIGIGIDVTITNDRYASVAHVVAIIDGEAMEWTGSAKLFPGDRSDPDIGARLALSRALENAARQLGRQANGIMSCNEHNDAHSKASRAEKAAGEQPTRRRRRFRRSSSAS